MGQIDRPGHWLGPPRRRRKRKPAPPPVEPSESYGVRFTPVRCPQCLEVDKVITTSTRRDLDPPLRYHKCKRCDLNFKSIEYYDDD